MKRPNILFMMPDQLRADFVGCYGAEFARTPRLDELAKSATMFERCLSPNPICVPARASMMTGQSSLESGILVNDRWLRPDRRSCGIDTWPELLSEAGYATYGVGKMHFTPWDASEGFQTRIIAEDKRHIDLKDDYHEHLTAIGEQKRHGRDMAGYHDNGGACISPLSPKDYVDAWCADQAIDLLKTHDPTQPFAMMIGFPSPHCPYDPPAEIAALFDPQEMPASFPATHASETLRPWLVQNMKAPWADIDYSEFSTEQIAKVRAHYVALIYMLDRAVGRILDTLVETGVDDDTLIVFSSDHGDFVGDFGLVCKNFFMDGAVRVPMILRVPGRAAARRTDTVTLSDVYPTFLAAAGITLREGVTFRNLMTPPPATPRAICGATHRGFMIERDRMKLARYVGGLVTLYDMRADPQEQISLAENSAHFDLRQELEARLTDWQVGESLAAHNDKRTPPSGLGLSEEDRFSRGWQRVYPHNPNASGNP
ncbi:sulfatase [Sulfitobacter mediterraneus]|uniref:sulfatase family protein n=1 Tax=Sulfitobacter mediterraneus TaxID=83219 RepID=UPI0021A779D3|nr:sulfatase-like hydrolase/transferase [Sulfitobacter mediterraneus]UWR13438.1 sulfatase-like hydrolase/transferase [Sulfitobacter mediterraneus]